MKEKDKERMVQHWLDHFEEKRFAKWMRSVEEKCWKVFGISLDDMPDACWRDYFNDEMQPHEALVEAAKDWCAERSTRT